MKLTAIEHGWESLSSNRWTAWLEEDKINIDRWLWASNSSEVYCVRVLIAQGLMSPANQCYYCLYFYHCHLPSMWVQSIWDHSLALATSVRGRRRRRRRRRRGNDRQAPWSSRLRDHDRSSSPLSSSAGDHFSVWSLVVCLELSLPTPPVAAVDQRPLQHMPL